MRVSVNVEYVGDGDPFQKKKISTSRLQQQASQTDGRNKIINKKLIIKSIIIYEEEKRARARRGQIDSIIKKS